jgi:hypothetical protein
LVLLLGGEVIRDIESLSDLLGWLALDHICNSLTSNIQERFNVKIVGCLWCEFSASSGLEERLDTYENDLKKHLLINLHELLIPLLDISSLLPGVIIGGNMRIGLVVLAPFEDLSKDALVDLHVSKVRFGELLKVVVGESEIVLTLGIGTSVDVTSSPRSSTMLVMSIERIATERSIEM